MVNKQISFSKCILNYGNMKADCKYYKSASVEHTTPKEQCLCPRPALHCAELDSQPAHRSLSWAKALCSSAFGWASLHSHSACRSIAPKRKCITSSVAKAQTVVHFLCFRFHICCE